MKADERRTLTRTVLIATVAAALTAYGVFKLKNWTTPGRSPRDELAGAVIDSVKATLQADSSARLSAGPTTLEKQGLAERARSRAVAAGKTLGLGAQGFDNALKAATETAINSTFKTHPDTASMRIVIQDAEQIVVVESIVTTAASGPSGATPPELVMPLGRPLLEADDDDWLLARGFVSVRTVSQVVVQKHLLAWVRDFERCPTDFRVASHLALGTQLDTAYAILAERITPPDPAIRERLMPLCRRERLRRLADATLRTSKAQARFPFLPMVVLDDAEEATLKRLEDPSKSPLVGPEARAHVSGMAQAESDLKRENTLLRTAVRQALPSVLDELAATSLRLRGAEVQGTMPTWFEQVTPAAQRLPARAWACAALTTFAHPAYGKRAIARAIDAFTVEHWPTVGEREGLITALYQAAQVTPPKEGLVSVQQLQTLATTLLEKGSRAEPCDHAPPGELGLSGDQLDALASRLVP